jgi:hypothetical protein
LFKVNVTSRSKYSEDLYRHPARHLSPSKNLKSWSHKSLKPSDNNGVNKGKMIRHTQRRLIRHNAHSSQYRRLA